MLRWQANLVPTDIDNTLKCWNFFENSRFYVSEVRKMSENGGKNVRKELC